MMVYVIQHKVPGYDSRVCSVHMSLAEAKEEAARLDAGESQQKIADSLGVAQSVISERLR